VRGSYRVNAQGVPEVVADPLIAEPLRNTAAAAADLWPYGNRLPRYPPCALGHSKHGNSGAHAAREARSGDPDRARAWPRTAAC